MSDCLTYPSEKRKNTTIPNTLAARCRLQPEGLKVRSLFVERNESECFWDFSRNLQITKAKPFRSEHCGLVHSLSCDSVATNDQWRNRTWIIFVAELRGRKNFGLFGAITGCFVMHLKFQFGEMAIFVICIARFIKLKFPGNSSWTGNRLFSLACFSKARILKCCSVFFFSVGPSL